MENFSSLFSAGKVGSLTKHFYFMTVIQHNNYKRNGGDKMKSQLADLYEVFVFPERQSLLSYLI